MIWKDLIGYESEPSVFKIRPEEVRRFAEAIGVRFYDRVPETFIGRLIQINIPGVELNIPGIIHGEEKIVYYRSINIGDTFTYKKCIKDVYERMGRLGTKTVVVIETNGYDLAGELVFTSSSVVITPSKEEGK